MNLFFTQRFIRKEKERKSLHIFSKIFKRKKNRNESQESGDESENSGWNAIDEITNRIYPTQRLDSVISPKIMPIHDRTGKTILFQLAVFDFEDHWLYVSYGCSELFDKTWEDSEWSGLGYELTLRLKKNRLAVPPMWPMPVMNDLAFYALQGYELRPGQSINFGGPIDGEEKTKLTGFLFLKDRELPSIDTPNGKLQFLQLYGLDKNTLEKIRLEGTHRLIVSLEENASNLLTDLD